MRTKVAIFAIASLLAVPAYAAAWAGKGQAEPSTLNDKNDGYMWPGTDTVPTNVLTKVRKVYFSGFTTHSAGFHAEVATGFNPNLATVGTEKQDWPGRVFALMGVWKDCNNDGYIGSGDNALFVYRSELLAGNTGICPSETYTVPAPNNHDFAAPHNDGRWVNEFIPIGPDATRFSGSNPFPDNNQLNINDPTLPRKIGEDENAYYVYDGTKVWADWNKPGALPPNTRCYVFAPEDTYHTTGGMLEYIDCSDGYLVTDTYNSAANLVGADDLGFGQISFDDEPRDHSNSSSALNRPNPWGDEEGPSMVTAFDCGQPPLAGPVSVPGTSYRFRVSQPKVPTTNSAGSIGGTLQESENAVEDCDRTDGGTFQLGGVAYAGETGGIQNTQGTGKIQTDFVLKFSEGFMAPGAVRNQLGFMAPADGGVKIYDVGGLWIATTVLGEDRNPYVDRDGLDPQPVTYMSFYAYVSPAVVSKWGLNVNPVSKTGTYGTDNCVAIGTGAQPSGGWQCDPNLWWPAGCSEGYSCGTSIDNVANVDASVRVGQLYNLRDVDCYDASIKALRDVGIGYGVLTGTECK